LAVFECFNIERGKKIGLKGVVVEGLYQAF
jgi:hypothetical protein